MEERFEGVDDEGKIHHSFTKQQLSFLLGIPNGLTKKQAYVVICRSVEGLPYEGLIFRLRGDVGLDQHAGGGDGIDVMDWVIQNSYEGEGAERKINPQKVVDLIFQLRDEAASSRVGLT